MPGALSDYAARFETTTCGARLDSNGLDGPRSEPTRGGDDGTRTHDLLVANQVLYQLSYVPSQVLRDEQRTLRHVTRPARESW